MSLVEHALMESMKKEGQLKTQLSYMLARAERDARAYRAMEVKLDALVGAVQWLAQAATTEEKFPHDPDVTKAHDQAWDELRDALTAALEDLYDTAAGSRTGSEPRQGGRNEPLR